MVITAAETGTLQSPSHQPNIVNQRIRRQVKDRRPRSGAGPSLIRPRAKLPRPAHEGS
jgi:hypothetical protein